MSVIDQIEKLNPYTARVDRAHPTAFVFLIDQSGSMDEEVMFEDTPVAKKEFMARAVNTLLDELINRCTKPEEIRHYFDIALIGYGADDMADFISLGDNSPEGWLSPEDLKNYARYEKQTIQQNIRGTVKTHEIDVPYWVEPTANYVTPMHGAFRKAKSLLSKWCKDKVGQDCYPPVVINITDGIQTDAEDDEMIEIAQEIMQLTTIDGNVLVFNIHISNNYEEGIIFPTDIAEIGNDDSARMLYEMSSTLPKIYKNDIKKMLSRTTDGEFKAMGYNQNVNFVNMLNIGTITNMSDDYE